VPLNLGTCITFQWSDGQSGTAKINSFYVKNNTPTALAVSPIVDGKFANKEFFIYLDRVKINTIVRADCPDPSWKNW